ncbi:MAG: hypothetical protein ACFE0Q_02050 [Anaerolineae bacterium]
MTENQTATQSDIHLMERAPSSFEQLYRWLLHHMWFVYTSSHIYLTLSPAQAYQVLEKATRPSVKRLGLRKLFVNSRRYFIRNTRNGGFQMMTTSRTWWHPKRRTPATAILSGTFEPVEGLGNRIKLSSHIKLRYFLSQFLWPTFISSIVIFLDWFPLTISACILALYGLSVLVHRYTAKLEAHEITFFIETVLGDFRPEIAGQLSNAHADVVMPDDAFTNEWARHVEKQHQAS